MAERHKKQDQYPRWRRWAGATTALLALSGCTDAAPQTSHTIQTSAPGTTHSSICNQDKASIYLYPVKDQAALDAFNGKSGTDAQNQAEQSFIQDVQGDIREKYNSAYPDGLLLIVGVELSTADSNVDATKEATQLQVRAIADLKDARYTDIQRMENSIQKALPSGSPDPIGVVAVGEAACQSPTAA